MLRSQQARGRDQDQRADERGEVGRKRCADASAQRVPDQREALLAAGPAQLRARQHEKDLAREEPDVLRVRRRVGSIAVAASEEVEEHDAAPVLLDEEFRHRGEGYAWRAYAMHKKHLTASHRAPFVDADAAVGGVDVPASGKGIGRVGEGSRILGAVEELEGLPWRG